MWDSLIGTTDAVFNTKPLQINLNLYTTLYDIQLKIQSYLIDSLNPKGDVADSETNLSYIAKTSARKKLKSSSSVVHCCLRLDAEIQNSNNAPLFRLSVLSRNSMK